METDSTFQRAEEELEEARRKGAQEFSFIDKGLMQLPESLGELTELQSLDLSFNQLMELPDSLIALKDLFYLKLEGNPSTPRSRLIQSPSKLLDLLSPCHRHQLPNVVHHAVHDGAD